jgi:RNA polymerase sigma factor (sigma-70 family)
MMQESTVMARPAAKIQADWRDLYLEYRRAVFAVCYSFLGNVPDADNAVQETFIKAARHLHRLGEVRDARLWLTRIAVRTCLDMKKSFWGRLFSSKAELSGSAPAEREPEHTLLEQEEHENLRRLLLGLPEKQRAAVTLKYFHDLDTQAIAQAMNISPGSVKTHLHRGIRRLKHLYEVEP